jgi:hypothetical protein
MFTARRRSCTLHYSHKAAICQQSPIIHLMTKPTKLDTIHVSKESEGWYSLLLKFIGSFSTWVLCLLVGTLK